MPFDSYSLAPFSGTLVDHMYGHRDKRSRSTTCPNGWIMPGNSLTCLANLEAAHDFLPNPLFVIATLAPNRRLIALLGSSIIDQCFS
jgi:hypothetical protein